MRPVAIAVGCWCGFLIVAGTTWNMAHGRTSLSQLAGGLLVTAVGLALIAKVPGNRISWLMMLVGVVWSWIYLGNALTIAEWRALFPEAVVVTFVWVGHWLWFIGFVALVFAIFRFPDGTLVSPRWRWAWWTGVVGSALVILGSALGPFQTDSRFFDARHRVLFVRADLTMSNPIEIADADVLLIAGAVPVLVFATAAVISLFVRYRRAPTVQRAQIRWVGFAAAVSLSIYVFGGYIVEYTMLDWEVLTPLIVAAVPSAIAVAITRYRLYDIDRIVSRSVGYTIVVGVLATVFAIGALWLPQQLPIGSSNLAVAASTLVVAALFNPLRRRVQRVIDRRFHRLPYDPAQVVDELTSELRNAVEPHRIVAAFTDSSIKALRPESAATWLRAEP